MINRLRWWQWLIIALLISLIGFFALVPEWKQQTVDAGLSDAALRNPYLAVQRLAEANAGKMRVTRELSINDQVLDQHNTLVLQNTFGMLNDEQVDELTLWLRQGGQLIIGGYTPDQNARALSDPLFTALGIEVLAASPEYNQSALDSWLAGDQCGSEYSDSDLVSLNGHPVSMAFYSNTNFYSLKRDETSRTVWRRYGAGKVIVLPDLLPLSNFNIECEDHAKAAWALLEGRNTLWIWAAPASNWLKTLIKALPVSSALVLLTLLLWLWRRASRVGPARMTAQAERPSISHHHAAIAQKLWQQKDKDNFAELVAPLMRYAKRTLPEEDFKTLQAYSAPQTEGQLLTLYKRLQQLGVLR